LHPISKLRDFRLTHWAVWILLCWPHPLLRE
jgi:hypothetical protein